jgi:hypothetical protein
MANLAGYRPLVDGVLQYLALIGRCLGVTIQAIHAWSAVVAMGVFCAIAVVLAHIMAVEAGHPLFQPMDTPFNSLVLALILVGHTGTMAGHTGILDRSDPFDFVFLNQTAKGETWSADVALAAGRMA